MRIHTISGRTTVPSFKSDRLFLRSQRPGPEPLYLILDCYSMHRGPEIRQSTQELGITLLFIPAGMTDSLQPLDRATIGAMKATARPLDRTYASGTGTRDLTTKYAAQVLVRALEQVSPQVLDAAWAIDEAGDK